MKKSFKPIYLSELRAALITIYRNGFVYDSRLDFWRYMWKALWLFPDRIDRFVTALVVAEHYYDFRKMLISNLTLQMEKLSEDERTSFFKKEAPVSPAPV